MIDYDFSVKLFAVIVSSLSFIISFLAFKNARQTRIENAENNFFKLKIDVLSQSKEVVISYQELINDLRNEIFDYEIVGKYQSSVEILNQLKAFLDLYQETHQRADDLHRKFLNEFDSMEIELVKEFLKTISQNKLTLNQCKNEAKRKYAQLKTIADGINKQTATPPSSSDS